MTDYTERELIDLMERFLTDDLNNPGLKSRLLEEATTGQRSFYISHRQLTKWDSELALYALSHPVNWAWATDKAIESVLPVDLKERENEEEEREKIQVHSRLRDIFVPSYASRLRLRDIRRQHVGKVVSVEGVVQQCSEVRPLELVSTFQCVRCGALIRHAQQGMTIKEPIECDKDQGGCGKGGNQTAFTHLTDSSMFTGDQGFNIDPSRLSTFVDTQRLEMFEIKSDGRPERMVVNLKDDLCGHLTSDNRPLAGQKILLNAMVKSKIREKGNQKLTVYDLELEGISIEQAKCIDLEITEDDELTIRSLARLPEIGNMIRDSVAPQLHGMLMEKAICSLTPFSGMPLVLPSGGQIRNHLNILLVGDPGSGKTALVRSILSLIPVNQFAHAKIASVAGLTAAAVPSEWGDGRYELAAGLLALADGGIAGIDEIDKAEKEQMAALHEALEDQQITVTKAGIHACLPTRCPVLCTANPKSGYLEEEKDSDGYSLPFISQFNILPSILSRMDQIVAVQDKANEQTDREMAMHMMMPFVADDRAKAALEPPIARDMLIKYIEFTKNVEVRFPYELAEKLAHTYSKMRNSSGTRTVGRRQLHTLRRLATATARMHLRQLNVKDGGMFATVTEDDIVHACKLYEVCLARLCGKDMDIGVMETGKTKAQYDKANIILRAIPKNGMTEKEIARSLGNITMSKGELKKWLLHLAATHAIHCTGEQYYRDVDLGVAP